MLKAIVNYSKKIPVPGAEFSSQGYSLSLETEISAHEPAAIQAQLHNTFELVKASVEQELANGHGPAATASPGHTPTQPPAYRQPRATEKASNKQIKFITDLATRQGIALSALNARVRQDYGVDGLYELDRKQASDLLDQMNARRKAA